MAQTTDAATMFSYMERALTEELKASVINNVTKRLVDDFRETARAEVESAVKDLAIGHVESIRDLMKVRDEIHVFCHWEDEK